MKYLRTFEDLELEYTDGDRVILDLEQMLKNYSNWPKAETFNFIRDLDSNNDYIHIIKIDENPDSRWPYKFSHIDWSTNSGFFPEFYIQPTEIFGLATPENIEKYEKLRAMRKFNL